MAHSGTRSDFWSPAVINKAPQVAGRLFGSSLDESLEGVAVLPLCQEETLGIFFSPNKPRSMSEFTFTRCFCVTKNQN